MRKILILSVVLVLLGGCYDYRETDDMAIVTGMLLEKGENSPYKMTFEIANIGSGEGEGAPSRTTSREGLTMAGIVDSAAAVSGKKLYFGHMGLLCIDSELAKEGIGDVMDYFLRQTDMRLSMDVAVSKGFSGEELFKAEEGEPMAFVISSMLKANEERAISPDVELYRFVGDMRQGIDGILPVIAPDGEGKADIDHIAIFDGDRMVLELDSEDSENVILLMNIGSRGGLELEREKGGDVSLEIRSRKAKITPCLDSNMSVDVEFTAGYGIAEIMGGMDIMDRGELQKMENDLTERVRRDLERTLTVVRDSGCDIFGLENELIKKTPRREAIYKESFLENYRNAAVSVAVKSEIIDSGRQQGGGHG